MDIYRKHTGRTLVMTFQVEHEWKVPIGGDTAAVAFAIEKAMRESGMMNGSYAGVIPETVKFHLED